MGYEGIVITGTSCAGKSAVGQRICQRNPIFQIVPAVTTRKARRSDIADHYEYVSKEKFRELAKDGLFIETSYRGDYYGITKESYESVLKDCRVPILIITPESVKELIGNETTSWDRRFISVFLDAPDNVLNERLTQRQEQIGDNVLKQRHEDRENKKYCIYDMINLNLDSITELIISLWEYRSTGGILPKRLIRLMIKCSMLLDGVEDLQNIQSASYDLSLGDEYYSGGEIRKLTDNDPFLRIDPYDYAIVMSAENANLPRDIAGRFGLSVRLFCQGVILSNGPQVDPGFRGKLFCLLFNTSNSPVILKRRQHYATIEFIKLVEASQPYEGIYQDKWGIIHYLPSNTLKGAVSELKEELEDVKAESRKLNTTIMGVISVLLAIIAILLTFR